MRALVMAMLVGCSTVDEARVDLREPDPATFPAVSDALAHSCGSLDCHGQVGRNFRMYWANGLRLAPGARPGEGVTSADEYQATYRSLIALEPFTLDLVIKKEIPVDKLTLVRKARGSESHKGGGQIAAGSDADRCLTSWLLGALDAEACKRATPPS